jgi:hypothetical protein
MENKSSEKVRRSFSQTSENLFRRTLSEILFYEKYKHALYLFFFVDHVV